MSPKFLELRRFNGNDAQDVLLPRPDAFSLDVYLPERRSESPDRGIVSVIVTPRTWVGLLDYAVEVETESPITTSETSLVEDVTHAAMDLIRDGLTQDFGGKPTPKLLTLRTIAMMREAEKAAQVAHENLLVDFRMLEASTDGLAKLPEGEHLPSSIALAEYIKTLIHRAQVWAAAHARSQRDGANVLSSK